MDYALVRQLKDAGFPQEGRGKRLGSPEALTWKAADLAYQPTLEELIEACDQGFGRLAKISNTEWSAWENFKNDEAPAYRAATATEAVARLWLALNPKRYARHEAHKGEN